jgi:translation initiation factor IF-2
MKKQTTKQSTQASKEKSETRTDKTTITEGSTLKEISERIGVKTKLLVEKLDARGLSSALTDEVTQSLLDIISEEFDSQVELISIEEEVRRKAESAKKELVLRPPVVTMMGHVDHGKTTLLDSIRESNLVGKESGGITQHIGAYRIRRNDRFITFIDTPGHEAFTQLRARGAKITDIVVLVIAADDGVMPQTSEAINHAKAAGVPILVAINKIDKAEADVDKVKQSLSKEGLLVEDWGGDVVSIEVSAKEKTNLNELFEMILLLSDVIEIKANPQVKAQGVILEAKLDSQKGAVASVIIQHGILDQGSAFISGTSFGKAKALFDENGKSLKRAEPSMPIEVMGFSDVPEAGDFFQVVSDLDTAKRITQHRKAQTQTEAQDKAQPLTLDQLFQKIEKGDVKELNLIIKADVKGSVEVLKDITSNLSSDKVKVGIIHAATGRIKESDVLLASASKAIIIGYNIKPDQRIKEMAKEENVEIRSYQVIYQLTEDIKKAVTGLLEPTIKETYLGRAEIKRIYRIPRVGAIAGCLVVDGKMTRNAEIRIIRNDEIIHQGKVSSLKHLKNNVAEVTKNYECGIGVENFKEIEEGDFIEAFITEKIKPK